MLTFNFPEQVEHTIQTYLQHPKWITNTKNYKKRVNSTPIASLEEDSNHSYVIEENNSPSDKLPHNEKIALFTDLYVEYCTDNIEELFPKEISS